MAIVNIIFYVPRAHFVHASTLSGPTDEGNMHPPLTKKFN